MSDRLQRTALVKELLEAGTGYLLSTDLRALGLMPRAVDAVFQRCGVVAVPGYSRPMVRVEDFAAFMASCTYRGDRVRPC